MYIAAVVTFCFDRTCVYLIQGLYVNCLKVAELLIACFSSGVCPSCQRWTRLMKVNWRGTSGVIPDWWPLPTVDLLMCPHASHIPVHHDVMCLHQVHMYSVHCIPDQCVSGITLHPPCDGTDGYCCMESLQSTQNRSGCMLTSSPEVSMLHVKRY